MRLFPPPPPSERPHSSPNHFTYHSPAPGTSLRVTPPSEKISFFTFHCPVRLLIVSPFFLPSSHFLPSFRPASKGDVFFIYFFTEHSCVQHVLPFIVPRTNNSPPLPPFPLRTNLSIPLFFNVLFQLLFAFLRPFPYFPSLTPPRTVLCFPPSSHTSPFSLRPFLDYSVPFFFSLNCPHFPV